MPKASWKGGIRAASVLSVLLFALLGNYIFSLHINFRQSIDWGAIIRLLLLLTSSIVAYWISLVLESTWEYASAEYNTETSAEKRAADPMNDRFERYLLPVKRRLLLAVLLSSMLLACFFLVEPLLDLRNA